VYQLSITGLAESFAFIVALSVAGHFTAVRVIAWLRRGGAPR
jgi:hypothetical protein